jgi:hypothetical protein
VTTGEFATLQGVLTTTTVQSQINSINNTLANLDIDITTLEQLQNMDLTQFSTVGTELVALQQQDAAHDTAIGLIETDVGNLQSNVASNTGRLNVYDSLTLDARVTAAATTVAQHTTDIGSLQTDVSSNTSAITTKHPTIDVNNVESLRTRAREMEKTIPRHKLFFFSIMTIHGREYRKLPLGWRERKMCLNDKTKKNDMSSFFSISLSVITRQVEYFRACEF